MIEKVNPCHPDKVADRIAGALVDIAYSKERDPRIAVEVLIGHGSCTVIAETSVEITKDEVAAVVARIAGRQRLNYISVPQDEHLADNQSGGLRCGDNGIFRGCPVTMEQQSLSMTARALYTAFRSDGKYILDRDGGRLIICQSNATDEELRSRYPNAVINPLGPWTGGTDVDSGATNRKLGSDMADSVTGGGLHGKDLSKADVSVNIWCFLEAQRTGKVVEACCAIGDTQINGVPYHEIVELARGYIERAGGFEKFAEWGLY